jgi:hypothetical protein
MVRQTTLRRFAAGNPLLSELTASRMNAPLDAIDDIRNSLGRAGVWSPRIGDGWIDGFRLGVITDEGPPATPGGSAQTDDTAKARYWVKTVRPVADVEHGEWLELEDETKPGVAFTVRATNLGEPENSHVLSTDETQYVQLMRVVYSISPPVAHWFFISELRGVFPVRVQQTGGSQGDLTNPASYTYTVRSLSGATLGTNIGLRASPWTRPDGTVTVQSGSNGLGLAIWVPNGTNDATLVLMDAGEVPGTGGCP